MKPSNKFANPFYLLLLVVGIAFVLTATGYGVLAFRDRDARAAIALGKMEPDSVEHPLMMWMGRHGETALMAELALLAVFTVGAIATDDYWQRLDKKQLNTAAKRR